MNLSFAGCGFLGIYHVGVAVSFKKYAPHLLLEKIGGASAGSLAACCLLCDLPLDKMTSDFFRVVNEARRYSLGPFSPSFNIQTSLLEGLQKYLPEDTHKRVNGRLHISLTRVYDGKNVIISEFESREEVLQALLCACFIPGFSGLLPPRFRGVRYMDGAFSDNLPILDENTITVSPFCGESDICPRDQSSQLFHLNWANTSIEISRQNVSRFVRILFPPRPEFLSKFCQQGFDDALQFLHRNNLINCRRCIAVQSTYVVPETVSSTDEFDPDCRDCKKHRNDALSSHLPETVLNVIQDCIEQANKGLANWIFKHRGIKLLSLPATVPMDFFLATITKITKLTPKVTKQMRQLIEELIIQLNNTMQLRLLDKFALYDQPHFDATGLFHSNHLYGAQVSILVEQCGTLPLKSDAEHASKISSHNEALYAYYYTDDNTNKVKVTEIFDYDDVRQQELDTDIQIYEGQVDDYSSPYQNCDNNVREWNCIESDFFIDAQTPNVDHMSPVVNQAQQSIEQSSGATIISYPENNPGLNNLYIKIE